MRILAASPSILLIFALLSPSAGAADGGAAAELDRAYGLLREGRDEEAAGILQDIPPEGDIGRRARLELAYLHLRRKRWKEAVALLGEQLDRTPDDPGLRLQLGYARLELGDRTAAADEFALAARAPGEHQEQARSALKALSEEPPSSAAVRGESLLNRAYEDLRRDDPAAAREKFQTALREDPGRTLIVKQLGYMSAADGDMEQAAARLEGARRLEPGDHRTALELGYIYDSLHDEDAAERSFAAALASRDPRIRASARRALDGIRGRTDPLYLDIEASAVSSSRFANKILYAEARAGWKPVATGPFSVYAVARGSRDSRSHGGETPEIYSDDAVSLAPGLRLQPKGWNTSLTAEWGVTVNLIRSDERPDRAQTDGRVVLSDYRYWRGPRRLFADAGLAAGWYGRYRDNVIGSLRARAGLRLHPAASSSLTVYAPVNFHKDSNRDFYNNIVEAGAGLEFQPRTEVNLSVRGEYLRGWYAGIEGRDPNPYGPRYDEIRVSLVYHAHFSRRPQPAEFEPTRQRRFVW